MYRNIELNYNLNDDKSILVIEMKEETSNSCHAIVKEYDLVKYDEESLLYNQALEDFEAEDDDILADLLNKLIDKILKENE